METKVQEVNTLIKLATAAETKKMYGKALDYYRQAGEILVSLCLYLPLKEQKEKMKARAEDVLKRGTAIKKLLRDAEFAKVQKSQGKEETSKTRTEFIIVSECADFYEKIGFEFYRKASDKDALGSKKIMLKSAINAHLAQVQLKKTVIRYRMI